MDEIDIKTALLKYRIIPVVAIEKEEDALPLADALIAGGLPLIEITFRTAVASAVMAKLHTERAEILLGAGTILTIDELKVSNIYPAYLRHIHTGIFNLYQQVV